VISSASIADRDRATPRYSSVLSVEAWDRDEIAAAGTGALAAVARGSHEQPRRIVLRYEPPDAAGPLVAFVGKGVTLDTGGLWPKPKDSLAAEKYDMSGGAAVLEAIGAIAERGLRSGWSAWSGQPGTRSAARPSGRATSCTRLPSDFSVSPGASLKWRLAPAAS
jgi:leucyl aminopeptidase